MEQGIVGGLSKGSFAAAPLPHAAGVFPASKAEHGKVGRLFFGDRKGYLKHDEAAAARVSERISSTQGLPQSVQISFFKDPSGMASSAGWRDGGMCRVAVVAGKEGVGFHPDGFPEQLKKMTEEEREEMVALHEAGHCEQDSGRSGAFSHPGVGVAESALLARWVFNTDVPKMRNGDTRAYDIYAECFADAYATLKWMERRGFSEGSKEGPRELYAARVAARTGRETSRTSLDPSDNHYSEDAVAGVVAASGRLAGMGPAERMSEISKIASMAAAEAVARAGPGLAAKDVSEERVVDFLVDRGLSGSIRRASGEFPETTPPADPSGPWGAFVAKATEPAIGSGFAAWSVGGLGKRELGSFTRIRPDKAAAASSVAALEMLSDERISALAKGIVSSDELKRAKGAAERLDALQDVKTKPMRGMDEALAFFDIAAGMGSGVGVKLKRQQDPKAGFAPSAGPKG